MLNIDEKIEILDKRIEYLTLLNSYKNEYISLINNGMEDPDMPIELCNSIIYQNILRIDALNNERYLLIHPEG